MFPLPPEVQNEVFELGERIRRLPPRAQLELFARMAGNFNHDHFPPTAEEVASREQADEEYAYEFIRTNGFNDPPHLSDEETRAELARFKARYGDPLCDAAKSTS